MNKRGFTLIELIIILAVVGITAVFVIISVDPYKDIKLDAAAKKIAADLVYARNIALSTAKWYGISFEVDPVNTYSVYQTDGKTDLIVENPSQLGKHFIVNISDYYDGVTIKNVNIAGDNKVIFSPLGIPYNDKNGSAITEVAIITIGYSKIVRKIQIAPNTGRIYIP